MRLQTILGLAAVLLLSSCGGGGGDGGGGGGGPLACTAITGGDTVASSTGNCTSCTTRNLPAAADGNVDTATEVEFPTGAAGNGAIRVTAQDGIVYPAGTPAFVINAIAFDGQSLQTSVVLSTYLDGVLQQSSNVGAINTVGGADEPRGRRGFNASLPFDAIELSFQRASGTGSVVVSVFEFCTS